MTDPDLFVLVGRIHEGDSIRDPFMVQGHASKQITTAAKVK
jgi:hypothetical protein